MSLAPSSPPPDLPSVSTSPAETAPAVESVSASASASASAPISSSNLNALSQSARLQRLRPVLSCGGALGLGLLLAHALVKPVARRAPDAALPGVGWPGAELPRIFLSRDATLVVQAQRPPGALMRGQIRLVADVMGRSPVAGEVARQLVEPGTRVKRGDAVMEISSGSGQRVAPQAETLQNQAEQSQIQASDAQTALAQKVAAAQAKLQSAQGRVERAQAQVGAARDIVRRLQNGETVASAEIPPAYRTRGNAADVASPSPRSRAASAAPALSRSAQIAQQQSSAARDAAREGVRDLQSARQTLALAQNSARDADDKLKTAAAAVSATEARFEDKKASGADVETARQNQREAQSAATAAAKALVGAQAELSQREKSAASLEQYAAKAEAQAVALGAAKTSPPAAEALAAEAPESAVAPLATAKSGAPQRATLEEAAGFAQAALDESRRASRDAERIHLDIENYQRDVASSRSQVESASQNLVQAQQKVLDSVPRPRFTAARAPADGIVTWISRLAREVGAGQSIFGLARGGKVGAHFEDKSNLWRNLKPGDAVPALLVAGATKSEGAHPDGTKTDGAALKPTEASIEAPTNTTIAPATPVSSAKLPAGTPVTLKITEVQNPAAAGEAAIVAGDVSFATGDSGTPGEAGANFGAGMDVLASVAQKNEKPTLSVPISALVQRGGATYLAVLSSRPAPPAAAVSPAAPITANSASAQPDADEFHLQWQRVQTGRSDGLRQEITAGLAPGTRVVVLPWQLEGLGLAPTVDKAAPGEQVSSDLGILNPDAVVVRLTSSPA